jgi:TPR repeat protein
MCNLALACVHGEGVAVDTRGAVSWLGKAAERGSAKAMYQLGAMYAAGRGVRADPQAARAWWVKAARLGDEEVRRALVRRP